MSQLTFTIERFTQDRIEGRCRGWDEFPQPGNVFDFGTEAGAHFYAVIEAVRMHEEDKGALFIELKPIAGNPDTRLQSVSVASAEEFFERQFSNRSAKIPLTLGKLKLDLADAGHKIAMDMSLIAVAKLFLESLNNAGLPLVIIDPLGLEIVPENLVAKRLGEDVFLSISEWGVTHFIEAFVALLPTVVQKDAAQLLFAMIPPETNFVRLSDFNTSPLLKGHPLEKVVSHYLQELDRSQLFAESNGNTLHSKMLEAGCHLNFSHLPVELVPLAYKNVLSLLQNSNFTSNTQVIIIAPETHAEASSKLLSQATKRVILMTISPETWFNEVEETWCKGIQGEHNGVEILGRVTHHIKLFVSEESMVADPNAQEEELPMQQFPYHDESAWIPASSPDIAEIHMSPSISAPEPDPEPIVQIPEPQFSHMDLPEAYHPKPEEQTLHMDLPGDLAALKDSIETQVAHPEIKAMAPGSAIPTENMEALAFLNAQVGAMQPNEVEESASDLLPENQPVTEFPPVDLLTPEISTRHIPPSEYPAVDPHPSFTVNAATPVAGSSQLDLQTEAILPQVGISPMEDLNDYAASGLILDYETTAPLEADPNLMSAISPDLMEKMPTQSLETDLQGLQLQTSSQPTLEEERSITAPFTEAYLPHVPPEEPPPEIPLSGTLGPPVQPERLPQIIVSLDEGPVMDMGPPPAELKETQTIDEAATDVFDSGLSEIEKLKLELQNVQNAPPAPPAPKLEIQMSEPETIVAPAPIPQPIESETLGMSIADLGTQTLAGESSLMDLPFVSEAVPLDLSEPAQTVHPKEIDQQAAQAHYDLTHFPEPKRHPEPTLHSEPDLHAEPQQHEEIHPVASHEEIAYEEPIFEEPVQYQSEPQPAEPVLDVPLNIQDNLAAVQQHQPEQVIQSTEPELVHPEMSSLMIDANIGSVGPEEEPFSLDLSPVTDALQASLEIPSTPIVQEPATPVEMVQAPPLLSEPTPAQIEALDFLFSQEVSFDDLGNPVAPSNDNIEEDGDWAEPPILLNADEVKIDLDVSDLVSDAIYAQPQPQQAAQTHPQPQAPEPPKQEALPVYKNQTAPSVLPFTAGETVFHKRYGQGVVKKVITMNEEQVILNISFQDVGKRLLDPSLTPLERAS